MLTLRMASIWIALLRAWMRWRRARCRCCRAGLPCACCLDLVRKLDCAHGLHRWGGTQHDNVQGWWRTCRYCGVMSEREQR